MVEFFCWWCWCGADVVTWRASTHWTTITSPSKRGLWWWAIDHLGCFEDGVDDLTSMSHLLYPYYNLVSTLYKVRFWRARELLSSRKTRVGSLPRCWSEEQNPPLYSLAYWPQLMTTEISIAFETKLHSDIGYWRTKLCFTSWQLRVYCKIRIFPFNHFENFEQYHVDSLSLSGVVWSGATFR